MCGVFFSSVFLEFGPLQTVEDAHVDTYFFEICGSTNKAYSHDLLLKKGLGPMGWVGKLIGFRGKHQQVRNSCLKKISSFHGNPQPSFLEVVTHILRA